VNIDHLKHDTTTGGPISWITSGKLDAVLDIKFSRDPHDDLPFNAILGEIADAISTSLSATTNPLLEQIPGRRELAKPPLTAPERPLMVEDPAKFQPRVIIDMDLRFKDVKAAVPIFTNDLSYVNNALIRPIVAFVKCVYPLFCYMFSLVETRFPAAPIARWCLYIVGL
jgi:mitochondrial distribution and morphology protein 31